MPAPLNICFLSSVVPRGLQRGPSVGLGRVVAVCQKETNTIPAELCRIASCTISRARSWLQAAPNSRGWCALHRPRSCYHRPSEWLSTNPFDPIGARESRHPAFPRSVIARRSEEHTSELQSHLNLVCRLLLEKKKQTKRHTDVDVDSLLSDR